MQNANLPRARRKFTAFALETIDYQSIVFGKRLEAIFAEIKIDVDRGVSNKELAKSPKIEELVKLVSDTTGITIAPDLDSWNVAAIMIMPIAYNNPMIRHDLLHADGLIDYIKKAKYKPGETGNIDLKNAKVSGIFSKYKHTLYINFNILYKQCQLSPGELTGIFLHELGHAFTWYEVAANTEHTNMVLQSICSELFSKKKNKDIGYIYRELTTTFNMSEKEVDSLINSQNETIMGMKLFTAVGFYMRSQVSKSRYWETTSEQMADQFATRFGYGRELLTGLDKLMKEVSTGDYRDGTTIFSMLFETVVYLTAIATSAAIMAGFVSGIVVFYFIYSVFMSLLMGLSTSEAYKDMTYDGIKDRYVRIRNEAIGFLKDATISNEDKATVIESVKIMDNIMQSAKEHKVLASYIFNWTKANRALKEDREYQQLLETLANNDLFLKSAELDVALANP